MELEGAGYSRLETEVNMKPTIEWKDNTVVMIDQRKLPNQEIYVCCRDHDQVADAIEKMVIRGAPAIGVAAAYGIAIGVLNLKNNQNLDTEFQKIYSRLEKTRPTARNLFWALEEMKSVFLKNRDLEIQQLQDILITEAKKIDQEDLNMCK